MKNLFKTIVAFLSFLLFVACSQNEFSQIVLEQKGPLKSAFSQTLEQLAFERKVDLLVVVDNSTSMLPEQEKLSREFSSFISSISDSDYRIGVITTDTKTETRKNQPGFWGNLDVVSETGKNFISKSDINAEQYFANLINREETVECAQSAEPWNCISFEETPLRAIKMAIEKRHTVNKDFFRYGADLAVIIISDEDETGAEGEYFSAQDLKELVDQEFIQEKKLLAFTIAIVEGDTECFEEQKEQTLSKAAVSYGTRIGALADLTGGFKANICNADFGRDLSEISNYVKKELLPLKVRIPEGLLAETLRIDIKTPDGENFEFETRIEDKHLYISPTPPEGSKISINFEALK